MVLSGEQEKESIFLYEDEIEKSVPQDHPLSSLGLPRDAKRQSSGWIFLCHSHTHDGFGYSGYEAHLRIRTL